MYEEENPHIQLIQDVPIHRFRNGEDKENQTGRSKNVTSAL